MAGRIRIQTKKAAARLEELGLDPIEALVRLFRDAVADGDRAMQLDCLKFLTQYGYSRAPAVSEASLKSDGVPLLSVNVLQPGQVGGLPGARDVTPPKVVVAQPDNQDLLE